jgi:acetyl-CoA C-acetyltransferase
MAGRVGIVAASMTKFEAAKPYDHLMDLVIEVTDKAVEAAGINLKDDVEAVISCSQDHWDGRTISSMPIPDAVCSHLKDESKVAGDGAYAVLYGAMHILSGDNKLVLVVSHCEESITDGTMIENWSIDHIFHRQLGIDYTIGAAMQARRYMDKYKLTPEQFAKVVVKNKGNARKNTYAQEAMDLTVEQVLKSKMLANPITELQKKPVSDGACAMILANEEVAKKLTPNPVWITGVGNYYEPHNPGDRDLAECEALMKAAKKAYKMAGISKPAKDIDLVELSEYYAPQELLWTEGLGLCGRGEGGKLIDSGKTQLKGSLPVNPSGGLLSGIPVTVAGMTRVAEAVWQLQGKAGEHQVQGAKRAVAHGCGGLCGQMHCVLVLEKGGK